MKHSVYIPSLSTATLGVGLHKDKKINGKSIRFYDKNSDLPDEFKHPAFLITAGAHYKNMNAAIEFGLPMHDKSTIVMADSGGHQISTGTMKYSKDMVEKIFLWLENNSNVAMLLDVPPRGIYTWEESMKLSKYNFDYFNTHQTGKTEFLNVMQGANLKELETWYEMASKFNFQGWAFATGRSIFDTLLINAILIKNKEHLKPNNHIFHWLGASKIIDFLILEKMQSEMHKMNPKIQYTTDSASPTRSAAFGNMFTNVDWNADYWDGQMIFSTDWKKMAYKSVGFSTKFEYENTESMEMPTFIPYDDYIKQSFSLNDVNPWNELAHLAIPLHNLYFMLDAFNKVQSFITWDSNLLPQVIGNKNYKIIKSIEKIFRAEDPVKEVYKYKELYDKYDNSAKRATNNKKSLFNF